MKTDKLRILEYKDQYVVVNDAGEYANHTHLKKKNTCELLIKLIKRRIVPRSSYLRTSAKRLTLDEKYKEKIDTKTMKDKQKPKYYNHGGGRRA